MFAHLEFGLELNEPATEDEDLLRGVSTKVVSDFLVNLYDTTCG